MNSNAARTVLGVAVIVIAVVLLVVLKGGSGSSEKSSHVVGKIPTIVVKGGEPVGGVHELTYRRGEEVRFKVESDVSDEIHVHGYDLMKDVEAGGSVSFDVPATLEGVFEVELEKRGEQIAELTVNP